MTSPDERASRTSILTVDDDPAVSRAVARDLRRRYGDRHRIVRAESGEQALDALREIKLRGEVVALLLADHRMPGMSGLEFLEQAADLFPSARRLLLTAYADTSAAIDAINVVDLDYYLLKPWDPPEEKLYPVIDAQLEAWSAQDHQPVRETKVVGHRWSAASSALREFLARNQVSYRWYAADSPEGARLMDAAQSETVPLVITPDGTTLTAPTHAELAAHVGLTTTPAEDFYDLVVVGGGPAGLGAAVYGASEGLRTVLIERVAVGGQAGQSSRIENYLGFPDGVSGAQLADRARRQAVKFGAELITTGDVVGLEVNGAARTVRFADGSSIGAHAVILATGVKYRRLGAEGLEPLTGVGVYYGSALTEAASCVDRDVYVVGGANSAGQAAVYLARGAKSVTLLVRAASVRTTMSHYLVEQLEAIDNVHIRTCSEVIEAQGEGHLERLTIRDAETGTTETVDADHLFVFIGAAPHTEWLADLLVRDARGFIVAGPDLVVDGALPTGWILDRHPFHLETSVPGVFAAGDARSDSPKRVASAVGEGSVGRHARPPLPGGPVSEESGANREQGARRVPAAPERGEDVDEQL